jgi:L-ribulose-5-phosphate 3-epimerase
LAGVFRLGYNTNGFAHHRLIDAVEVLGEMGYEAVSITPDVGQLDPYDLDHEEVAVVRHAAERLGLELTVETGSRFLLDPVRKHRPALLEDDPAERARRLDFLLRHVDLAADLGASVVSLWAGAAPKGVSEDLLWTRLVDGLRPVLERGAAQGVRIAFEPEPGMFVERPQGYGELVQRLGADGEALGLCLDVGHCCVTGDLPIERVIHEWSERLVLVQLDDCRKGEHVHRMFGEGDLDLSGALGALLAVGYDGVAAVELSRDSHRAPEAARQALDRLRSVR